uniref:Uncharacterized protein n=1 Tax=Piliocolobus tephrosceles TaxID=591936 RepID=A0A8C9IWA3_9PRIM
MESALPTASFLYWVGTGTVAYLAWHICYSLFTALWVWGVGNKVEVGPGLGEWAVVTGSSDELENRMGDSEPLSWQRHVPRPTIDHLFCSQDLC